MTCGTAAIGSGFDIKTVQGNLDHATAAFTLDVYGHVTDRMKRESADKLETFIRRVSESYAGREHWSAAQWNRV